MKIACICEDGASVTCIASGLIDDHEIVLLIIPDFNTPNPNSTAKSKKKSKRSLFSRIVNRLFFSIIQRKVSPSKVEQIIAQRASGKRDLTGVCKNVVTIPTHQMNAQSTADLIASHEPDILFVCGAPILRENVFDIPKYGSVNFHFGYSPIYKGQHTLIWAFNRGDHKSLGGTFLKIDKGVDTGGPVMFVFPHVDHTDSLEMIEAKLALFARTHISEALQAARENKVIAVDHPPAGSTEFMIRYNDYRVQHHLRYYLQLLRNKLLRRGSLREEEIQVK